MTASFNLLDEPWIPCLDADGALRELGLRETLAMAPSLREVTDSSPLVTIALHRLLLAVLHRALGPATLEEWGAMWEQGHWDMRRMEAYLNRWRERFDLFHPERPFYQTTEIDVSYAKSVATMVHGLTLGNYVTLFDHTLDHDPPALSPAAAARYLVAYQAFGIGGTISYQSRHGEDAKGYKYTQAGPLTKGAITLVRGANLFETLMLNLQRYDGSDGAPFDFTHDVAAWERDTPARAETRWPDGYVDLLTWQARRVRLCPEDDGAGDTVVRSAVLMMGYQFPASWQSAGREPMLAFVKNPKPKPNAPPWFVVGFQEDRALWRDSLSLFQSIAGLSARPRILDWVAGLAAEGVLDNSGRFAIDLFGMAVDPRNVANVRFWRHERLPLPVELLHDRDAYELLAEALDLAERVGRLFGAGSVAVRDARGKVRKVPSPMQVLARNLASPADVSSANKDTVTDIINGLAPGRIYWAQLGAPFTRLVIAVTERPDRALVDWADEIEQAARGAFGRIMAGLDTSARALKAGARAEREFESHLRRIGREYQPEGKEVTDEPAA